MAAARHVKANLNGQSRGSSPGHPCHGGSGARSLASHKVFLGGLWWFHFDNNGLCMDGGL